MTEFPLLCIRGDDCDRDGPHTTEQRAWFCPDCTKMMRHNLDLIADSWLDLSKALIASGGGIKDIEGRQKNGGKTHGLELNETASRARAKAGEHLRWMTRDLLDRYDEDGRTLVLPEHRTVPAVAKWMANQHVHEFAAHPFDHMALECWDDLSEIRSLIMRGAYPLGVGRLSLGLPCEEHITNEAGERVPCPGELYTMTSRKADGYSDIVCSEDREHRVAPSEWLAGSWRRRHSREMDQGAVERLMRGIGLRHASETT